MSVTAGKQDWKHVTDKRAAEWGTACVGAVRKLKASNRVYTGEAFLALISELSFRAGAAFALRRMAREMDESNPIKPLTAGPFPSWLESIEDETDGNTETEDTD